MKVSYLKDSSKDITDKRRRRKIHSMFTSAVFMILLITYLLVLGTLYLLIQLDVVYIEMLSLPTWLFMLIFLVASFIVGFVLTIIVSKFVLSAVNTVAEGMGALAKGNFDVRIDLGKNEESKQLATGFNNLAQELKGISVLRSSFVNEFAHEFKTPIVSIKGFAEILKQGDLTEKQRVEYLDIIIEEANRLTTLSSNSLNLSKIENQRILTDLTTFNVSEQIRNSILLLEKKWQEKNLELSISLEECDIIANEELLKQVWINLIDNAIKFSNDKGTVEISLKQEHDSMVFCVVNGGETIKEEDYEKVFEKFYTNKHATESGHGIGLTIVKKIVELHNGKIEVLSENQLTKFTVILPKQTNKKI